ncbi:MAG TPA: PAS domain S-box protein [Methylomirabilota bacterium]|nr:PAS domain S-box protein [Methylomirabilota bacterium]
MERSTQTECKGTAKELSIIVIEDEPADAQAIEQELREAGLRFRSCRLDTRAALLRALASESPDIVLSDFTLPELDGWEALNLVRQHAPGIPFILVTGTRSEEVAVECIKQGADDYILKASLKRLPSSVINALQKRAAEQARAQAEAARRRSEEQFRLITENSHDLISVVDLDWKFIYASPSFRTCLGHAPGDLAGTSALALVHPEDQPALVETWQQSLARGRGRTVEFRARTASGGWLTLEAVNNWMFDDAGHPQRCVIVSRDISSRRAAEEALREMPRLIRDAQEAERRRVARELHDSVNQILASVKFRLQAVEDRLAPMDQTVRMEARKARELLERTIQEVRRISRNLRPSELDDLGLAAALRSLAAEFQERTGIAVEVACERLPRKIPSDLELNIYRIVQEALTNVERHARAARVCVRARREGTRLRVEVSDDGRGLCPQAGPADEPRRRGMGLVDMRERAAFMGGTIAFRSSGRQGTEIVLTVPLVDKPPTTPVRCEKEQIQDSHPAGG